jgi:hypothetical protein
MQAKLVHLNTIKVIYKKNFLIAIVAHKKGAD